MKTILLWDPRFPDRRPMRLTVEDSVASAAVRAGVAAAANPAEAGALSAGAALDPTMLTEVVLQHGNGAATRRVFLPYSVVMVGALAGVLAAIGTPIAGGVTPTPSPTPTIAFANTAVSVAEGNSGTTTVSNTINVTRNGVTGPLTINLSYGGTATSGTDYVSGPVSGTIADGQSSLSFDLTINGDTGVESDETIVINAVLAAYSSATASKTITVTNDDVTVTPTPLKIAFGGSSTPARYFSDYTGYTDNTQVTKTNDGTTFTPLGGIGAGAQTLGNILVTNLSRPVQFLTAGDGGTSLVQWEAAGSSQRKKLVDGIKAMGGVAYCVVQVGFNDVSSTSTITVTSHAALLRSLLSKIRSESGYPNLIIVMGGTQRNDDNSTNGGKQLAIVRRAEMLVANDANNVFGCHTYDILQADGVHQTEAGYVGTSAPRFAAVITALVKGQTVPRGARVVGATPISQTKTRFTIAHGSGTDFTPASGITGFAISTDNGETYGSGTGERVDAITVDVSHVSTGGLALLAGAIMQGSPDYSAELLDNTSPVKMPMDPTTTPISVAATGAPAVVEFADTFTAADDTALAGKVPDTGAAWAVTTGSYVITSNRARCTTDPSNAVGGTVISSANQYAEGDFAFRSLNGSQGGYILARCAADGLSHYSIGYRGSNASGAKLIIGRTVNGTFTQLATAESPVSAGASQKYRIEVVTTDANTVTITIYVDGAQKAQFADTAANRIQTAGRVGLRVTGAVSGVSTGIHFDNIKAGPL